MNEPIKPIILCHAACTGGSVIFRKMCERFGLWGFSEISHFAKVNPRQFSPYDPQQTMYVNGWMDQTEMERVFCERIQYCYEKANLNRHQLLIREHTHSLFFEPESRSPTGFSWFCSQQENLFGQKAAVVVTYRDPVDSWLGLRTSFPKKGLYGFDEYCQRYNRFLDAFDSQKDQIENLCTFRYEEFVADSSAVYDRLASTLPMVAETDSSRPAAAVISSGNSGRQSDQLGKRGRRPYSIAFLKAAEQSESYARLAERLEYPHCCESITVSTRLAAYSNSARKNLLQAARWVAKPILGLARNASVSD